MTEILRNAFAAASKLPSDTQDRIGRELLTHLDRLGALRADLDRGLASLDAGAGRELDVEATLRRLNARDEA